MKKKINIIIPVYNEGNNIHRVLNQIVEHVRYDYVVYIVYDNEDDTTVKPVKEFSINRDNILLLKNKYGKGGLNAIITGYSEVKDGVTLLVMADLTDEIHLINTMFERIEEGYDVVCGSRYMKGGKQVGGIFIKKILSRIAGVSLHYIINIPTHDISNSFKMYRTEIIKNFKHESTAGFEIIVELIIKSYLSGYKITEIPTTWTDIDDGNSQFQLFKWLKYYIHWYLYAIKNYFFKKKKNQNNQ